MDKLLFIYNPYAGKGLIKPILSDIIDVMVKGGFQVEVHTTQYQGEAIEVAKRAAESLEYDRIICSGGDGTLDEVVTGVMTLPQEKRPKIGYIPAGSTNDFGNSLGISKDMVKSAGIAVNGKPFKCDIGSFNNDSFVYVAAFGIFTEVSYSTRQELKNIFGHAAYIIEGAKQLRDIPTYRMQVEYDGNVLYDDFILGMVTNTMSVGGFTGIVGGDSVGLDDGVFEVTLIRNPRNPIELNEILGWLTNIIEDSSLVYSFRTKTIKFTSNEIVPWTLDGEFGGKQEVVVIENRNKAIEIMVE